MEKINTDYDGRTRKIFEFGLLSVAAFSKMAQFRQDMVHDFQSASITESIILS